MPSRSIFRRPAVLLILALCGLAAIVSILGKLAGDGEAEGKPVALSNPLGGESYPALSPDNKRVAYSGLVSGEAGYKLFIRDLPEGERRQLTSGPGSDTGATWSPDGSRLAFLRVEGDSAACFVLLSRGGAATKVSACATAGGEDGPLPAVAWSADGQSLVVALPGSETADGATGMGKQPTGAALALAPLNGGAPKRITDPPVGIPGDSSPVISPDGKALAFVRSTGEDGSDIFVTDLAGGKLRQLTFEDRPIRGLTWTADGADLVYACQRGGAWRLWRLPASGGSPRDLTVIADRPLYPTAARSGRLVYVESPSVTAVWEAPLSEKEGSGRAVIRSQGWETGPSYSPDGKRIANISDQSGFEEIWVGDSNGGNRVRLTQLNGNGAPGRPRWSPDGGTLLSALRRVGMPGLYKIRVAGGAMQRVIPDAASGSWSMDGKVIYYELNQQIWKAKSDGTGAVLLSSPEQRGSSLPQESPDGKFVYFRKWGSIWRVPSNGGSEEEVIRGSGWGAFHVITKGVYYAERSRGGDGPILYYYDFASGNTSIAFRQKDAELGSYAISSDGKSILYARVDRSDTKLMLIEGFR